MKIFQTTSEFAGLEEIWNGLLSRSPANNFFLTWEWLWTWWRLYAEPGDTLALFIRELDNSIAGIAPCYIRTTKLFGIIPVRRLFFLGTQQPGHGDVGSEYMDLICGRGDEKAFVSEFFKTISDNDICDELCFFKMGNDSPTITLFRDEAFKYDFLIKPPDTFVSPYILLPGTWNDYLKSRSSSMRYKIRNECRRLHERKNIVFKKAKTEDDLESGFKELIALNDKRWVSQGMKGVFSNQKFRDFHRIVMSLMLKKDRLELIVLYENNQSRAAIYNILYNGKIYFYQSGIDTTAPSPAFGYLLHSHCIENAIKDGLREYDFLLKGMRDGYKDHFANSQREIACISFVRSAPLKRFERTREWMRRGYRLMKSVLSGENMNNPYPIDKLN